jgi:hypothetical protein
MLTLASLSLGNAAWVPSSQWHESRIMIPLASFFFGNHPWVSTLHCRDSRIMVALGGLYSQTSRGFPSPLPRVPDNGHPRRPLVRKPRVGSPFPLPRMPDNGHPRRPLVRKPRVSSSFPLPRVPDNGHPRRMLLSSCSSKASPLELHPLPNASRYQRTSHQIFQALVCFYWGVYAMPHFVSLPRPNSHFASNRALPMAVSPPDTAT